MKAFKINKRITITITEKDCKNVDFLNCGDCAVSRAFKRQVDLPKGWRVSEGVFRLTVYDGCRGVKARWDHRSFTFDMMHEIQLTRKSMRLVLYSKSL